MPRILVADDNTNIQKMVALAFHERGIDVTSVGNGEAAVRRLPDLIPDIILADIFMPVRNGYELCEWVKKDAKYSHIPVILLVGAFDPLDEKEARRVGADGVLKKPFIPPDPLIAMVTAALEKNSRLAAEAAKAKEAASVPAAPPAASAETPLKIESKVAPEFPEPSADEATLAYGFGTGRRVLDEEGASQPSEPIAPQAEKEAEEEFDGASTTPDWRRSAMDFEIPEETSRKPAFSSDEDQETTFPSEKDVPPRHIRVPDHSDEIEAIPEQAKQSEPTPAQPVHVEAPARVEFAETHTAEPRAVEPQPVASAEEISAEEAAATPDVQEVAAADIHPNVEPEGAPKATHWMDLMASTSEQPSSDWFATTFAPAKAEAIPANSEPSESLDSTRDALPVATVETPVVEAAPTMETQALHQADAAQEARAPERQDQDEESFFADDPVENGTELLARPVTETQVALSEAVEAQPAVVLESKAEEQARTERDSAPATNATPSAELISEESGEPNISKDPELIEPAAVRVTPEPLLVDETPRGGLSYALQDQEIAPPYAFLSTEQAAPSTSIEEPVSEEPVNEEPVAAETHEENFSVRDEEQTSTSECPAPELDQRAPTTVPSREALSEIPFLNPPPAFRDSRFRFDDNLSDSNELVNSAAVDTIVQRVIERIEPHLVELLSQNVLRPLVEQLLQSELEKKDR